MRPVGEDQRLRLLRPADDLLYREGTGGSLDLMYRETRAAVLRRSPGQSLGS